MPDFVINLPVVSAVVTFAMLCGGANSPLTDKEVKEDKQLIMKVREAVEKKIAMEKIEEFVSKKATINTVRRSDNDAWQIVKIDLDLKESQTITLRGMTHAVYWMRKTKSDDWQIVGAVWTKKNEMKLFFGKVLEP